MSVMNPNDPVLQSLKQRRRILKEKYEQQPDELNRYRLVCHEQLLDQWASDQPMDS
jgi:hypothetical protein